MLFRSHVSSSFGLGFRVSSYWFVLLPRVVWFSCFWFYVTWVCNARFPLIELEFVMLDLAHQNQVPHAQDVSLLNSFKNVLTNEIVWILVLLWIKKNPSKISSSLLTSKNGCMRSQMQNIVTYGRATAHLHRLVPCLFGNLQYSNAFIIRSVPCFLLNF